jgi:hypothetical protein
VKLSFPFAEIAAIHTSPTATAGIVRITLLVVPAPLDVYASLSNVIVPDEVD